MPQVEDQENDLTQKDSQTKRTATRNEAMKLTGKECRIPATALIAGSKYTSAIPGDVLVAAPITAVCSDCPFSYQMVEKALPAWQDLELI